MFNSMQEAFDRTVVHLESQAERAIRFGFCCYKTPDGRMCAVGAHIPQGHKAQLYQGSAGKLLQEHPDLLSLGGALHISGAATEDTVAFWSEMQIVHDASFNIYSINKALDGIAIRWGLSNNNPITKWR